MTDLSTSATSYHFHIQPNAHLSLWMWKGVPYTYIQRCVCVYIEYIYYVHICSIITGWSCANGFFKRTLDVTSMKLHKPGSPNLLLSIEQPMMEFKLRANWSGPMTIQLGFGVGWFCSAHRRWLSLYNQDSGEGKDDDDLDSTTRHVFLMHIS